MSEAYDAGLLNDYGGGNVEWWHDYMRAELARAHEFYEEQLSALLAENAKLRELLRECVEAHHHGAVDLGAVRAHDLAALLKD